MFCELGVRVLDVLDVLLVVEVQWCDYWDMMVEFWVYLLGVLFEFIDGFDIFVVLLVIGVEEFVVVIVFYVEFVFCYVCVVYDWYVFLMKSYIGGDVYCVYVSVIVEFECEIGCCVYLFEFNVQVFFFFQWGIWWVGVLMVVVIDGFCCDVVVFDVVICFVIVELVQFWCFVCFVECMGIC